MNSQVFPRIAPRVGLFRKTLQASSLAWKVFRNPGDIVSLLGLGNLLTDTAAFGTYVEQVKRDPRARELVESRYSPGLPAVADLQRLPEGSLGRELARHLEIHKLGLYPFPLSPLLSEAEYLRERQREIHDLLHVLLSSGIEVHEEVSVNAFILGRAAAPISVLIVAGAMIQALFCKPATLVDVIRSAARGLGQGERALSPFAYRWEENLARPLADVRKDFGLSLS